MREDGGGAWDPKFLRSFNDWELENIQEFIEVTSNIKISPLEKDNLVWKGVCRGPSWLKLTSNCWKEFLPIKAPAKCYGTSISLPKLAFLPRRCGGVRFLPQLS